MGVVVYYQHTITLSCWDQAFQGESKGFRLWVCFTLEVNATHFKCVGSICDLGEGEHNRLSDGRIKRDTQPLFAVWISNMSAGIIGIGGILIFFAIITKVKVSDFTEIVSILSIQHVIDLFVVWIIRVLNGS